jgi:hypothetical protein
MTIIIHGVCGIPLGLLIGWIVIRKNRSDVWLAEDLLFPFFSGAAMLFAGITAWYGDRFWRKGSQWVLPIDAPRHTIFSRALTMTMMILGLLLSFYCLFSHFSRS